jgi:hypothetical protein
MLPTNRELIGLVNTNVLLGTDRIGSSLSSALCAAIRSELSGAGDLAPSRPRRWRRIGEDLQPSPIPMR